ncbi:hypothetical protein PORY_000450 [Pneumocystis oryctolagi]|uniref:Uncharacterized protein n=1 Tax=Pneumocystis oryctolagi TaxID=42067 RepID=A0ACB7CHQ3_9ASCO|nr:hypothetical protein PORY_000450 [Pneumocystis oryctolagi]
MNNISDDIKCEKSPKIPFPIYLMGKVIQGYGRGTKELQIPTANISEENIPKFFSKTESGIYYGWGRVDIDDENDNDIYPMVMSIGWNPYYNNEKRSVEVHFIHKFTNNFYNKEIRLIIMGFIRPERNYVSKELLIKDIQRDIEIAQQFLNQEAYLLYKEDKFLSLKNTNVV